MKRLLLIFALCLFLPRSVSAQSSSVDNFFRRYDASEGFTSVLLEQKMMQMMSRQAAQRGDKGLAVLLKDIEYIRIIALKGGDSGMLVRDAEAPSPPTGNSSPSPPVRRTGRPRSSISGKRPCRSSQSW